MRPDIAPGATFPDYELPDHNDDLRTLSELQGDDPMILLLLRGTFCAKDRRQIQNLVDLYPELVVGYAKIVTISTDDHDTINGFRNSLGAQWPFLSDPGRIVQKDLDIAEYTDPARDPMIPHTVVLEPGLKVYKIYNGYWYWGRPSIEEVVNDLRDITRRIRADWDLATPGLREAWDRGDHSSFWPYTDAPQPSAAGPEIPAATTA